MKKKSYQSTEEALIRFLISKYENSNTNEVTISRQELPDIGLSEQEVIRTIFLLKEDGMFNIVKSSPQKNLSMSWSVALKPRCVHYFEEKNKERRRGIREWLWWSIPTILSVGALIVAILDL